MTKDRNADQRDTYPDLEPQAPKTPQEIKAEAERALIEADIANGYRYRPKEDVIAYDTKREPRGKPAGPKGAMGGKKPFVKSDKPFFASIRRAKVIGGRGR